MATEHLKVILGLDTKPFAQGMAKSAQVVSQFNAGLNKLGTGLSVLGILALAKNASDAAAELKRTAAAVGTTVEEVQALGFAASQNGSSIEEMNKSLAKLSVNIGKANAGDEEAIRKFEKYGIALVDVNGEALDTSAVMSQIADKIKNVGGGAAGSAVAFDLLSESGVGLVQVLMNGSDGLEDFKRIAEETGNVISSEANDSIVELADTLNRLLGGALSIVTEYAGRAILAVRQLGAFAGELTSVISSINFFEALFDPEKARLMLAQIEQNFGAAIDAANRLQNADGAAVAIDNQRRDIEAMVPLLLKLDKLNKDRIKDEETLAKRIERLRKEESEYAEQLEDKTDDQIRADRNLLNAKIGLLQKQKELQDANNKAVQLETTYREKGAAIQQRIAAQLAGLNQAKGDRSKFTLAELAEGNPVGVVSDTVREDIFKAREVRRLENLGEENRLRFGDSETASKLFGQADEIRKTITSLRTDERFPFKGMEDALKDLRAEHAKLVAMAADEGINLKAIKMR